MNCLAAFGVKEMALFGATVQRGNVLMNFVGRYARADSSGAYK